MSTTEAIALVTALILFSVVSMIVVSSVLARFTLQMIRGPLQARIDAVYAPAAIVRSDLRALSLGRESVGVWQVRGNGALVLTREQLHFFMFVPQKDLRIPISTISEISFTHGHLGKATPYKLLKVHFVADGVADSIAWYVPDPDGWQTAIETLRGATEPPPSV